MLTNSRDIKRRLEADGWILKRIKGSHHQFKKEGVVFVITLQHPEKDLQIGAVSNIYKCTGWEKD